MLDEPRPEYVSGVAGQIRGYLDFKASLGMESHTRNYVLRDLDRFCARMGYGELTREAVEGWVEERLERVSPHTLSWISVVRDMAAWVRSVGGGAYVLPPRFGPKGIRRASAPFLLSQADVEAFFEAIPLVKWASTMRWQAACMFGLMHSCGLRPGEARRMRRGDVRAAELEIDVRGSKGGHSRRLAVTPEVADMVERCDRELCSRVGPDRPFLFCSRGGSQVTISALATAFRYVWGRSGLPREQHGRRATPYCLRHRFAYANIERWRSQGLDPNAMLPYLSRYMGHSSVEETLYYVHVSPDFLGGFAAQVAPLDALLPGVGFDA